MPEYDAFGREIGENTLAGLGGDSRSPAGARPEPAAADRAGAAPALEAAATPAPSTDPLARRSVPVPAPSGTARLRRRGLGGLGCLVGLAFLAVPVAGPIVAVVGLVDTADDAIQDVRGALEGTLPDVAETPPAGVAGRSLIAPANLRGLLADIERAGYAKLTRLVVRPGRASAEAVKGRRARPLMLSPTGGPPEPGKATPFNAAHGTVALAAVDPHAPARLVRNAAGRFRVRARGIDYVILSAGLGEPRWVAYFKNGVYVEGDARGRVVRRID